MIKGLWLSIFLATTAMASLQKNIRVGLIIPETRQDHVTSNPWGVQQRRGFELALNDVKNLSLEIQDNSESALLAKEKAAEFVKKDFDLVAGLSYSDQAIAVKQQTSPAGIPYLTVFGTAEALFDKEKSVFTMAIPNDAQVADLTRYLSGFPDIRKTGVALIVARNCEYCVDMERELKSSLKKQGIPITQYPDLLKNRPVPHDYFEHLGLAKYIVPLAYEVEGLSVINALVKRRYHGLLLGGDSWSTQTLQVANNLGLLRSICLVNTVPYDVTSRSAKNKKFVRDYKAKYGEMPTDVAALSYDAGLAIVQVAQRCEAASKRKECLANAMAHLRFEGVSGNVRFSSNGKRLGPRILLKSSTCASVEKEYDFHQ
ncbi:ABC transporter substrate-binding protein [bacterium]|nr:ABC transporter substrate-binding protein [bacterium]